MPFPTSAVGKAATVRHLGENTSDVPPRQHKLTTPTAMPTQRQSESHSLRTE